MSTLTAPCPLADYHDLDQFSCGVPALDNWLKKRARSNERSRASRTYVLCIDKRVIGYYALASGSLAAKYAPGKIKRNMPDPIPVMVLGRLAIDKEHQGKKLGDALLRDAILRILQAAEIAGIKAILVHAISEEAKQFYLDRSFTISPTEPMTLILPLESILGKL
ncbi:MAG: GNAT family N-acetyltransferase [Candidatus Thiodiazotropha lotti]|uniref:GNAT family N-acetyltransferase n=1 Tax=Candidatus Thiodiazotropha lotti TaxID=2792787 RepID=A0A9E4K5H7_9GAMM|nr:GNAT family N-acetyltransferase [Candidatus Thiodiazotropha lotti]MCG7939448.1 GNAT family N-acetyltransferase [Candidatus Thiodiazotropha lotti]MCG7987301.1 GNAT family N-acetyltransferase [Candidatus Thiodiazotropha lotti]MCG8005448.1 GNAT family N-acetyltransferase [Candidatus Thiodiazotropha lotti]MCG8008569.1 GNAT family N-acetyltransferase [Candidatus Thiodiazotropha lotti]